METGHKRAGLSANRNTGNAKGIRQSPNPNPGRVKNSGVGQHNHRENRGSNLKFDNYMYVVAIFSLATQGPFALDCPPKQQILFNLSMIEKELYDYKTFSPINLNFVI